MIDFINTEITENTFANLGDLIDPKLINEKINQVLKKNIDLRRISTGTYLNAI